MMLNEDVLVDCLQSLYDYLRELIFAGIKFRKFGIFREIIGKLSIHEIGEI